ncbi:hypothetical protein BDV93DRAFT_516660 [Ceratobasidium sp. AG-I]|nr:hypothetical protein BDV93DRAFT_516660 [Ceratobasidium sp. AG-I]
MNISPEQLHGSLAEETDGRPELAPICLPSRLGQKLRQSTGSKKVAKTEETLRQASCLQLLQHVRTTSIQKAQMISSKADVRGEIQNTQIQSMISRLSARVDLAIWEYQTSYSTLQSLGLSEDKLQPLQPLLISHLSGLTSILQAKRDLGEGYKRLPWFWHLKDRAAGGVVYDDEYNAATRIEWFRGRERYLRWEEEHMWIRREMATIIFDFDYRRKRWDGYSTSKHAFFNAGYKAYCHRQSLHWRRLRDDAFTRCLSILSVDIPEASGSR